MGWLKEKFSKGPPFVPLRVNLGIRGVMVAALTSIYFYSIVFEPPRIFYAVREQQRLEAEALKLAEMDGGPAVAKKSNSGALF